MPRAALTPPSPASRRYLAVAPFLRDFTLAQALGAAFETGLVDRLGVAPADEAGLAQALSLDPAALRALLRLLQAGGVSTPVGGGGEASEAWALTPAFADALAFRELMQCQLDFARQVAPDLLMRMADWLRSPTAFMRSSALYALFDYGRAFGDDPADREATRRWVRLTTALTRHEAAVLLDTGVFRGRTRLVDLGGNSGELVRQACERDGALQATVVDLPGVCAIGREHVAASPAASRITFLARDALRHPLPRADAIVFKSMLHDWPDEAAQRLLQRAAEALLPGGELVVFERAAPGAGRALLDYGFVPMVPFLHQFREPAWYVDRLREVGLQAIEVLTVELECPFLLVRGFKAG